MDPRKQENMLVSQEKWLNYEKFSFLACKISIKIYKKNVCGFLEGFYLVKSYKKPQTALFL